MKRRVFLTGVLFVAMAGLMVVSSLGCGDDTTKPKVFTLEEMAGSWNVTEYSVTSKTNPELTMDFIQLGMTITLTVQESGLFAGQAVVPDSTGPITIPFAGNFALDGDTVTTTFTPEILPYLTSFVGTLAYNEPVLTVTAEDGHFDFDGDGTENPAVVVLKSERM